MAGFAQEHGIHVFLFLQMGQIERQTVKTEDAIADDKDSKQDISVIHIIRTSLKHIFLCLAHSFV